MSFGRSTGGGRRFAPRQKAPVLATIATLSETRAAILVDVSRTGARVRGDDLPKVGSELILTMERVRTFGTVAWVSREECGIAFDAPLPAGEIQSLWVSIARAGGMAPELKAALDDWTVGSAR